MARSWLDDQRSKRTYQFLKGERWKTWIVQNEYRPVSCPFCDKKQYCRLIKQNYPLKK